MPDLTPEKLAELRRAALIEGHDAAHYPTSVVVPTRTLLALLDAAGERDALAAKVAALADWHETKAEKARRFRIEIDGRNPVMDKAAEVHTDAARRIRRALDEEPQP